MPFYVFVYPIINLVFWNMSWEWSRMYLWNTFCLTCVVLVSGSQWLIWSSDMLWRCDPVYEQLRGMLKFWSSMHCTVGLLYWDIATDLDISGCSRRCTKFVCVLSWSVSPSWRHGQASCTTLPSSKFFCLYSKIYEWLCCWGSHLVEKLWHQSRERVLAW